MRLLLDEMHTAMIAASLRSQGTDAVAITELAELRGVPDELVLEWATARSRAVVTENIGDFASLAQRWALQRRDHAGLVCTHPRRFHRGSSSYPADVTAALVELAAAGWEGEGSSVHWL